MRNYLRRVFQGFVAWLLSKEVCPGCTDIVSPWRLQACPTCHTRWCKENCYGDGHSEGEQCGACEYPN